MSNALAPTWGQRIREARLAADLSQSQLAERLGVDQRRISGWEVGAAAPRDPMRPLIADALGVDANDLFAFGREPEPEGDAA